MKKVRFGKDLYITWNILTDGEAVSLEGRDLMVRLIQPNGDRTVIDDFEVNGNTILVTIFGKDQKQHGCHTLELWENYGKEGQNVVDVVNAFCLVQHTKDEDE